MKNYLLFILLIFFTKIGHSAVVYDLICKVPDTKISFMQKVKSLFSSIDVPNYKYITITKGLREGHTRSTSKNNLSPRAIYFNLSTGKFVSSSKKENDFLELSYFISGTITVPDCQGSIIEKKKAGFID